MKPAAGAASPDAPGVLLVLNDIVEAAEEEFNRWYPQQHIPERLALPGFRTARRYRAVDARPKYMAVYECDAIEVLGSKAYLERLANPTDWTKKMMPGFRNMLRSACRETWSIGGGAGKHGAIIVQCKPAGAREDAARRFVQHALAPGLMRAAPLARMALWEADAAATGGPSPEMALRDGPDKSADWVLFLETDDLATTALALRGQLPAGAAAEAGLLMEPCAGYELIYAAAAQRAPRHAANECIS